MSQELQSNYSVMAAGFRMNLVEILCLRVCLSKEKNRMAAH